MDAGQGLLALLAGLLVVGGLAAYLLTAIPDSGTGLPRGTSSSLSKASTPQVQGELNAASEQACISNYEALQTAVSEYQVERGALPTQAIQLQPYFRGTLTTPAFTLSIDPVRPGQLEVQTPGHAASDGNANCRYAGP